MEDRPVPVRRRKGGHAFALALALLLTAPLVTMAVVTSMQHGGGGRMLAVVPPWTSDAEVLDTLAGAGAVWAVPLQIPGVWIVERTAPGPQGAAVRVVLIPITEDWSSTIGCAGPLRLSRRGRHA